ncbi:M48 family metalloprotease, partial [Candidatus Bathyarchaeota archaeon]|nr:M48 family metalloprotease [Candidatus Bathyarchaeota archaeon]
MSLNKLRLSMAGTAAIIIGVSTLGLALIMSGMGTLNLTSLIVLAAGFNLLQWLLAPYLINLTYRVKPLSPEENPGLHSSLEDLSRRSGIKTPKLMVSSLPIPNAFAYGSPLPGSHVAVTRGLLDSLDGDQVNAVVGHELGHIKHRDMHLMMMASFL